MNSKIGMFSVLVLFMLIPAISLSSVSAQQYDRYYDEGYSNDYKYENYGEINIEKLMLSDGELELINEIFDQSGKPFELNQIENGLLLTNTEFGDTVYFIIPTNTLPIILPFIPPGTLDPIMLDPIMLILEIIEFLRN
ncbi:MAG: hypothetical protein ACPKPY_06055 [Nitrososphaeraceae archaeon]